MLFILSSMLSIVAQSCIVDKPTSSAKLFDKNNNYYIKVNKKSLSTNMNFYSEISIIPLNKEKYNNIDFNDLNVGALYFRVSNDTLFYLSFEKMKYTPDWSYSALPNKLEEQIVYTRNDTIGCVRHVSINSFRAANLKLMNITRNETRILYEYLLIYTKHPSHLGALESFQVTSDGCIAKVLFRLYDGRIVAFE